MAHGMGIKSEIELCLTNDKKVIQTKRLRLSCCTMARYLNLGHEITDIWDESSTEIIPITLSSSRLIPTSHANNLRGVVFLWHVITCAKVESRALLDPAVS